MTNVQQLLQGLDLPRIHACPDCWDTARKGLVLQFASEEFGRTPPAPKEVRVEKVKEWSKFGGKAWARQVNLSFDTPEGVFSFPVTLFVPAKAEGKVPAFVHIAFRVSSQVQLYLHQREYYGDPTAPVEEIIDGGCAVAVFCYHDVSVDFDDGFSTGIAPMYPRKKYDWGKIGMWAFAASRVMDYLQTVDEVDHARIAVVGHSRLGKTALWCGVQDERFACAISVQSGCAGAALSRDNAGERIHQITERFPHWFNKKYPEWSHREEEMPFDQHMLLAAMAPRAVYVSSAAEDAWACPRNEFLALAAAAEVYEALGIPGIERETLPETGENRVSARMGYHVRAGEHYFSREDWQHYIDFLKNL